MLDQIPLLVQRCELIDVAVDVAVHVEIHIDIHVGGDGLDVKWP